MKKSFNEEIARFFEEPTRDKLRLLLQNHHGEQNYLDFKSNWPEMSKVAKHILAMANSGGGVIVFGVSETIEGLSAEGIEFLQDKADVENKLRTYIPSELEYLIMDFAFVASEYHSLKNKKFQVLLVESEERHIPFISTKDGIGIKENAIYIRRGTSSEEVSYEELQKLLNIRIGTQYSSNSEIKLEEHLAQLKLLYAHIKKQNIVYLESFAYKIGEQVRNAIHGEPTETLNPFYPNESYDAFISRMIELKKKRIEKIIE